MGKATKHGKKRSGQSKKKKVPKAFRARKVDKHGKIKRQKGDKRMIWSDYNVRAKVIGQRKGGKIVADTHNRICMVHSKCDCVTNTDMGKMSLVGNMDGSFEEREDAREMMAQIKQRKYKKRGAQRLIKK